jgi:hypothetical protein
MAGSAGARRALKAMQVAAGVALPKDVTLTITQQEG